MNNVPLTACRYGKAVAATETVQETVMTHQLLSRRSHRKFLDDKLSEPLLTYLLACAQSAPSKSDLQQYSIVIVDRLQLRELINNLPGMDDWVRNAPHLLIFCADLYRGWQITKSKGFDNANNTLDMLVNSTGDAAIAMMAFVTAAESIELGCCPVSVVRN